MNKTLILGSGGFIGRYFMDFLIQKGDEVVGIDIKNSEEQDLRFISLNLNKFDRVYFLAWDVGGAKYLYSEKAQYNQLSWNLRLMVNVFEQIQKHKIKVVFSSTQLASQIDTVYGVTKKLGEVWNSLIGGVNVRFWNVYGPLEEPSERTHVVSDFIYQSVYDGTIKTLTDGNEKRQFIHIDDVCSALDLASDLENNFTYDITSFEWVSVRKVAKIISKISNKKIEFGKKFGSTPITPNCCKIPGWSPKVQLETGLTRMYNQLISFK
jgi:nucleoside-diphosphate-sugar epimerase